MKIIVPVKRVLDPNIPVRTGPDGKNIVHQNQPHAMNPFDEVALAKAAALCADRSDCELVALSVGNEKTAETLRTALAMGADRAIHIVTPDEQRLQSYDIALLIAHVFKQEHADLVMMGKQSVDTDAGQTPALLAGFLDLPFLPNSFEVEITDHHVVTTFERGSTHTQVRAALPAIVGCELHLIDLRPISLPALMKARKKPLTSQRLEELPVVLHSPVTVLALSPPPARPPCQLFDSVDDLARQLTIDGLLK